MNIPQYISIEEVQRVCRELSVRDWTALTKSGVPAEEAQAILDVVNVQNMPIRLEDFRRALEVELEHGLMFPSPTPPSRRRDWGRCLTATALSPVLRSMTCWAGAGSSDTSAPRTCSSTACARPMTRAQCTWQLSDSFRGITAISGMTPRSRSVGSDGRRTSRCMAWQMARGDSINCTGTGPPEARSHQRMECSRSGPTRPAWRNSSSIA